MAEILTDAAIEAEIAELEGSELVRLARREMRLKNKRRQRLYNLRSLARRGERLKNAGIDFEMLEEMYADDDDFP